VTKCRLQGGKQKDLGGHYHTSSYSSFYLEKNNLSIFKVQTLNPINKSYFSRGSQLTTYESLIILNGYFSVTLNDVIGQGSLTLTRVVFLKFCEVGSIAVIHKKT
jgi:hypothetical protein